MRVRLQRLGTAVAAVCSLAMYWLRRGIVRALEMKIETMGNQHT